jgi:glucose-1-phosphatase
MVLVDLGGVETLLRWLGPGISEQQLWPLWLRSPSVRAFETGRSDPMQFAVGVLAELKLQVAPLQFLESFAGWPTGLYEGALAMVDSIPPDYQTALLSNSNLLHWPRVMNDMGLGAKFEHRFASHLIGKIKPDAAAFEHVLDSMGVVPAQVLFLDDNLLNVQAARDLGMPAQLVRGVAPARHALQQAGIIPMTAVP